MRKFVVFASLAGIMLAIGACADNPTTVDQSSNTSIYLTPGSTPRLDQTPQGCVSDRDGVCTLEPVTPAPGEPIECDPYTSMDWCGDDGDCMSSGAGTGGADFQGTSACGEPREPDAYKPPPTNAPKPCPDYGCPPPNDGSCDPQLDTACYKPLTSRDSAVIANAIGQFLRPLSSIPDATARQECENMRNAFNTLYSSGRVFRGAYTTLAGDPGIPRHTGAWDPNTQQMHIDPKYLDRAALGVPEYVRELADTMLHEAAHALLFGHPNGYVSTEWGPLFTDPYFNRLGPGDNSCLVW